MQLEGKVAVITGGGSGIGRATALKFAREGARVVIAEINVTTGEETVARGHASAAAHHVIVLAERGGELPVPKPTDLVEDGQPAQDTTGAHAHLVGEPFAPGSRNYMGFGFCPRLLTWRP